MGIISNLLFGDNQNKVSYKDALRDKYYNEGIASNYDAIYGGLNDYLDKNYEGGARKYKADVMQQNSLRQSESTANYKANRNNIFGNGLIGGVLNPIAQTVGGVGDLAGLALSGGKYNAWDASKNPLRVARDIGSDLGALGETALNVLPMAHGLKVAKAGKAVNAAKTAGKVIEPGTKLAKQAALWEKSQLPKSIGQKMAAGSLFGAGYGATSSLREMGSENFDPGQFALSTVLGGGVGAGLAGLGGLWNKYTSSKVPTTDATPYQEALNNLKNNAGGAMYSDTATNLPAVRGLDTARVTLDNLNDDTLKQLYRSGLKNARSASGANEATTTIKNSKNLLQDFLKKGMPTTYKTTPAKGVGDALKNLKTNVGNTKAGTKISSLLKTKKGKILAGGGAGLLLAQLLRNRGQNTNNMSDEELQELYNYIYGGGQ